MAFEAENGNGSPTANSFASVQNYKDFANLRQITVTDNDDKIAGALVASTDWIQATFGESWVGFPTFSEQALDWPRTGLVNASSGMVRPLGYMPPQLVKATCILAVEALKGALFVNERGTGGNLIKKTIGAISYEYSAVNPLLASRQINFDEVRQTLSPLTRGIGGFTVER